MQFIKLMLLVGEMVFYKKNPHECYWYFDEDD